MNDDRKRTVRERYLGRPDPDANTHERVVVSLEVARLRRNLERLSALERWVLRARFGIGCEPHSRRGIAAKLRISPTAVRRLERDALAKLREQYTTDEETAA